MTALLRAHVAKAATVRSTMAVAAVAVAYPALGLLSMLSDPADDGPAVEPDTVVTIVRNAGVAAVIASLLVGVLVVAGEFRHGTIVDSLRATPGRARFSLASVAGGAVVGAAIGLAAGAMALACGAGYVLAEGGDPGWGDSLASVAGTVVVAALYGAAGAGLGALVQNPTAGVGLALGWELAVEGVLPVVLRADDLARWLPGGAADRILGLTSPPPGLLPLWGAAAMLVAVAAALTLLATRRLATTDLT